MQNLFDTRHALSLLRTNARNHLVLMVLLASIILVNLYSYLLFHTLAELMCVVMGAFVFIFAWNSARLQENGYLLLLGVGSLVVGGVDLLHVLTMAGLNIFSGYSTNTSIQLWLAGRYLQVFTFLAAALFLHRRIHRGLTLFIFVALTAALLGSIFVWKIFPRAYVEGSGLTPFNIASEYATIAFMVVAIALLWRGRAAIDSFVFYRLVGSLAASIVAEFLLTLYFNVTDIANLIGHLFKIIASFLLYRALVEFAFNRPYDILFRGLKQSEQTERQQRTEAEQALRESERKYRELVDNALTGVYQTSLDGTVLFVNPEMAYMLTFNSPADLIGTQISERYKNPKDRARLLEILKREKRVRNFETDLLTRDGQARSVLLSALLEGGTLAGMVRDITDRKEAEQALRNSEEQYRSTLESMMEGCQIIGYDWHYLFVNESVAIQGRRKKEELLGRTIMECYPGIENTEMFAALQRCMRERTPQSMVNEFTFPDGAKGWFELSIEPAPAGIFVLSTDITERIQAKARIETQMQRLAALHEIDNAITGTFDLRLVLNVVLGQAITHLGVDAASVLLLDPYAPELVYATGRGFRSNAIEQSRLKIGEGHAGRAALERRVEVVPNLPEIGSDFIRADLLAGEEFISSYAAPMIAKGRVIGVLEIFHRSPLNGDDEWQKFLSTLAEQAAIAVDNAHLFEKLQRSNIDLTLAYDATIEGWSHALDLRDKETEGHTQRVTELTEQLARAVGVGEGEIIHVRRGALLHDIGKMGIPDVILLKPDKLTEEEWVIMRQHPQFAYDMLSRIKYLKPALDIPYCHHEKWDGTGYPRGLKGKQIPLAARLFAVVDVYDALLSDRPYRQGWPKGKVLEHIKAGSGTHFDPKAVDIFLRMMRDNS